MSTQIGAKAGRIGMLFAAGLLAAPNCAHASDRVQIGEVVVRELVYASCNTNQGMDIRLVLLNGTLTQYDVAAGANIEFDFTGDMELRVVRGTTLLSTFPILPKPKTRTLPGGDQRLVCQDLNQDGRPDFSLRFGWKNRGDYKIYSLSPSGAISELPIKLDRGCFPMVDDRLPVSTDKISSQGNLVRVYNGQYNSYLASHATNYAEPQWRFFSWDGESFVSAPPPSENRQTESPTR